MPFGVLNYYHTSLYLFKLRETRDTSHTMSMFPETVPFLHNVVYPILRSNGVTE